MLASGVCLIWSYFLAVNVIKSANIEWEKEAKEWGSKEQNEITKKIKERKQKQLNSKKFLLRFLLPFFIHYSGWYTTTRLASIYSWFMWCDYEYVCPKPILHRLYFIVPFALSVFVYFFFIRIVFFLNEPYTFQCWCANSCGTINFFFSFFRSFLFK